MLTMIDKCGWFILINLDFNNQTFILFVISTTEISSSVIKGSRKLTIWFNKIIKILKLCTNQK